MNERIVSKIKEARIEMEYTQKDLATHLGKTAAAISDLERGKVQVSANDLYKISQFLLKPIEYFYGEDYGNKEFLELVAMVRNQKPDIRSNAIGLATLMLRLEELGKKLALLPKGEEMPPENIKEFYNLYVVFSIVINNTTDKLKEFKQIFDNELKIRNINLKDIPYPPE